jgi:hypothetical protein
MLWLRVSPFFEEVARESVPEILILFFGEIFGILWFDSGF